MAWHATSFSVNNIIWEFVAKGLAEAREFRKSKKGEPHEPHEPHERACVRVRTYGLTNFFLSFPRETGYCHFCQGHFSHAKPASLTH